MVVSSRRLLQDDTYDELYEIEATLEYNDALHNAFFNNPDMYPNNTEFSDVFADYIEEEYDLINIMVNNSTVEIIEIGEPTTIIIYEPPCYDSHRVEDSLINAVVILSIIDVLIFLAALIYIYTGILPRIKKEKGNSPWSKIRHRLKFLHYIVILIEFITFILCLIFNSNNNI